MLLQQELLETGTYEPIKVEETKTVKDLIAELNLGDIQVFTVLIDGSKVEDRSTRINPGQDVMIIPMIKGGSTDLEKKKRKKIEEDIYNLSLRINALKFKMNYMKEESDQYKEEVRGLMEELGINKIENEKVQVQLRKAAEFFDYKQFKKDYPDLAKIYIKTVVKTIEEDEFDKKEIKAKEPDAYNKCVVPKTPALVIKNLQPVNDDELLGWGGAFNGES